jgi:UDP-glucuronate decarboxylase
MNLLLTGATGFFGKALVPYLLSAPPLLGADCKLTLLSRNRQRFLDQYPHYQSLPKLTIHQGDILDCDSLPDAQSFTHIIHAAADSTHGPSLSPLQRFEQIVTGTRNLLDYATSHGTQRFLYISSGAVYGRQPGDLIGLPEDWLGSPELDNPAHAYGLGKRAAEHLCHLYREVYQLEVVIARCFAFVGPDLPLDVHFAIGNFIRDALEHEAITVGSDGTAVRSYLDQSDLAVWLTTMLLHGDVSATYNVGSDHAVSIAELAQLISDLISPGKPVHILGAPQPNGSRSRYVPDITKARQSLGLNVGIPLADAILRTAAAHRTTAEH